MDAKNKSKMVAKKFKLTDAFWTGLFVFIVSGLIWWGYGQLTKEDIKEGFFIKVKFDNIFGLEKDDEVMASVRKAEQFKKGDVVYRKGRLCTILTTT